VTTHASARCRLSCSSALRYERGRSGSASFAARPRGARRRSRSASRRCEGSAGSAGNRAAGTPVPDAALGTVAALRCAHLGILRRPPDYVERAALSKCCAIRQASERPGPSGTRAWVLRAIVNALDPCSFFSYLAIYVADARESAHEYRAH
jgi:hypothetical protein